MELPKTSLKVVYEESEPVTDMDAERKRLTRFIALFAQIGFKEIALNENSPIFENCYK